MRAAGRRLRPRERSRTERRGMSQRGEDAGEWRIEALMAVARVSISDRVFLTGLREDPGGTLQRHGFTLSPEEMRDVEHYFERKRPNSNGEIVRALERDLAELRRPSTEQSSTGQSSTEEPSTEERRRYWRL